MRCYARHTVLDGESHKRLGSTDIRTVTQTAIIRQTVTTMTMPKFLPVMLWAATAAACYAEPTTQLLWPDGAPGATGTEDKDKPTLISYIAADDNNSGAAIVICPGGGYGGLAMNHEGHDIALWLNEHGISAFICTYRHNGKGYRHPAPIQDAQRAIRIVRANAATHKIAPDRIGVLGFSAGGHLASTVATHFDRDPPVDDALSKTSCRPDFVVLYYPVIAFDQKYTHRGSQQNLLGDSPDRSLVESLSNERQVTDETPPTFLFHTNEDQAVPPENSIAFYMALRKAGVPAELHIYEKGRHGLGLARDRIGTKQWGDACISWLRNREVLLAE